MSTKKKTNTTPFDPGMFYQAPVKVTGKTVTIELPLTAAEYFGLDGPVVYWAPVGGVIQLSGKQPLMVIPMLCANAGQFVPQRAAGDAHEPTLPVVGVLDHLVAQANGGARRPRRARAATPLAPAQMPAPPVIAWTDWIENEPERR